MSDPRIGVEPQGNTRRVWPQRTIAGKLVQRGQETQFRHIGSGQFVVIDHALPTDFDLEGEIAKLTGVKAPAKKAE